MKTILLFTGLTLATLNTTWAKNLTVEVSNIQNTKGTVSVILFDSKNSFTKGDYKEAEAITTQKSQEGKMHFQFNNLLNEEYAFMVHHDENGNQTLDTNKEKPLEGYAFSNNKGKYATPKFSNARVKLNDKTTLFKTQMIYLP